MGLGVAIARLACGSAGGVAFHQKDFALGRVGADAIGQLARQSRAGRMGTPGRFLGRFQPPLGSRNSLCDDLLAGLGVEVQPQRES